MKAPHQIFIDYLAKENLRLTDQRKLILEMFLKEKGHVSVEEFHDKVKKIDSTIGKSTIYRALKHLCSSGLALASDFGDGVQRYELHWGQQHHDHLICEKCGKKVEVMDSRIEERQLRLADDNGFTLTGHRMNLFGICGVCRKKK